MQFLGKIDQNNRLELPALQLGPLLWEIWIRHWIQSVRIWQINLFDILKKITSNQ